MTTSLIAARNDHLAGRVLTAAAASLELLASDAAREAAALLLQVRIDQGWFGDAVLLARERFHCALPSSYVDGAAVLRMHLARIFAGAEAGDAMRAMYAVEASARAAGDLRLQALAAEIIAKSSIASLQLSGSPGPADAFDELYRRACALYDAVHDERSRLTTMLQFANALLHRDRKTATDLLNEVIAEAADPDLHLLLNARLRLAPLQDVDLDGLITQFDDLGSPLGRARVLRQKVGRAAAGGVLDHAVAAAALAIFREEGALLDLVGFSADLAEKAFALGHFEAAADAARESLAVAQAMPFPYGQANARLMLASALYQQGKFLESAAQYERIMALPKQYRRKRHLDVLPSIGFLLQVRQAERARRLALDFLADLDATQPTPELSIALHYLANANVDLRRWPEVYDALEQSASVDDAVGNVIGASLKRIELASWRLKEHWLRGQAPPLEIFEAAMRVFDEQQGRLNGIQSTDADGVRMNLHQARAMAYQAIGDATAALGELESFGRFAQRLGSQVHQTNYHTQAGLILHDLGRRGDASAAARAQQHLDEALARALRTNASDAVANAAYLAAANERVIAHLASDTEKASEHLTRALRLLEEADDRIAQLQTQYVEPGAEASQLARIAIHGPWKKVYDIAIELLLIDAGEFAEAYSWIEKWKGRALAVTLGLRALPAPIGIEPRLLGEEAEAITALEASNDFEALGAARDRLQNVWKALESIPEAAEYLSLRTGRPVTFEEVASLLADEEKRLDHTQSPTSRNGAQNDAS